MQNNESSAAAFYRFFGLSERNKILALVLVIAGLSLFGLYKAAIYTLSMIEKRDVRTETDNIRLRKENEKLTKEHTDMTIKYIDCRKESINKLDTVIRYVKNRRT